MATVLAAAALLVGASDRAAAQQANRFFWGTSTSGCTLSAGTLGQAFPPGQRSGLRGDLANAGLGSNSGLNPEVAFAIVYSLNENDGQPIGSSTTNFTGPVLCLAPGFARTSTTTDADIPQSGNANFLDMEQVSIIRYQRVDMSGNPIPGAIEKVLCHTVDTNVDCVRIF